MEGGVCAQLKAQKIDGKEAVAAIEPLIAIVNKHENLSYLSKVAEDEKSRIGKAFDKAEPLDSHKFKHALPLLGAIDYIEKTASASLAIAKELDEAIAELFPNAVQGVAEEQQQAYIAFASSNKDQLLAGATARHKYAYVLFFFATPLPAGVDDLLFQG